MVLCPSPFFLKYNKHIWIILQGEQEIGRDTFALGKMTHQLLRNTWFRRLLRLYPNTASLNTRCSPCYLAILIVRLAKAKRTQIKLTKMLLLVAAPRNDAKSSQKFSSLSLVPSTACKEERGLQMEWFSSFHTTQFSGMHTSDHGFLAFK